MGARLQGHLIPIGSGLEESEKTEMAAEESVLVEDVESLEAPRQSLLEVVQEKLAAKGLVRRVDHYTRLEPSLGIPSPKP